MLSSHGGNYVFKGKEAAGSRSLVYVSRGKYAAVGVQANMLDGAARDRVLGYD
jgi:hypothetical protein